MWLESGRIIINLRFGLNRASIHAQKEIISSRGGDRPGWWKPGKPLDSDRGPNHLVDRQMPRFGGAFHQARSKFQKQNQVNIWRLNVFDVRSLGIYSDSLLVQETF